MRACLLNLLEKKNDAHNALAQSGRRFRGIRAACGRG